MSSPLRDRKDMLFVSEYYRLTSVRTINIAYHLQFITIRESKEEESLESRLRILLIPILRKFGYLR